MNGKEREPGRSRGTAKGAGYAKGSISFTYFGH